MAGGGRNHRQYVDIELRTNIEHLTQTIAIVNALMTRTSMSQSWREIFSQHNLLLSETHNYVVTSLDGEIVTSVDRRVRDHIRKFRIRMTPYPVVLEYECPERYSHTPRGIESMYYNPSFLSTPNHNYYNSMRFGLSSLTSQEVQLRNQEDEIERTQLGETSGEYWDRIYRENLERRLEEYRTQGGVNNRYGAQGVPTTTAHEIQNYPWINPTQDRSGYFGLNFPILPPNLLNYEVYPGFVPLPQNVNLRNPQSAQGAQGQPAPAVDLPGSNPPSINQQEILAPVANRVAPIVPVNILAPTVPAQANIPAPAIPAPVNRPMLIVPALPSGSENTAPANQPEPMVPGENLLEFRSVSRGNGAASAADEHMRSLSLENEDNTNPPAIIANPPGPSAQGGNSLALSDREDNAPGPSRNTRKSRRVSNVPVTDSIDDIETEGPLVNDENEANIPAAPNVVKKYGKRKAPALVPQPPTSNPSVANERQLRSNRSGKRQKHSPGEQKGEEVDSADTPSNHPSAVSSKERYICKPLSGNGLPITTGSSANHPEENVPGTSTNIRTSTTQNDEKYHNMTRTLLSIVRSVKRDQPDHKTIKTIVNAYNIYKHANISEAKFVVRQLKTMFGGKHEASRKSSSVNNQVDTVDATVGSDRTGYCASVTSISSSSDIDDNIESLQDDLAALNEDINEINNTMDVGDGEQQLVCDFYNQNRRNQEHENFRNLDQLFGGVYEDLVAENRRVAVGNEYELYENESIDDAEEINNNMQDNGDVEENDVNMQENGDEHPVGNMDLRNNHVDELNRQIDQVVEDLQPVSLDMDPLANINSAGKVLTINSHPRMQIDVVVRSGASRRETTNEVPQNNEQANHCNSREMTGQRRHAPDVIPDNRRPRQGESLNPVVEYGRNHAPFPNVGNAGPAGAFYPVGRHPAPCFPVVCQPRPPAPRNDFNLHYPHQHFRQLAVNYSPYHVCTRSALFGIPLIHPGIPLPGVVVNPPVAQPRENMQAQQPQQNVNGLPPNVNPQAMADLESYMRPLVAHFGLEEMRQVANSLYDLRINSPRVWRQMQEKSLDLCNFLRNLFG